MRLNTPKARDCVQAILAGERRHNPQLASDTLAHYLHKIPAAAGDYRTAKEDKLLALAQKSQVRPQMLALLQPHLTDERREALLQPLPTALDAPAGLARLAQRALRRDVLPASVAAARSAGDLWRSYCLLCGPADQGDDSLKIQVASQLKTDANNGRLAVLAAQANDTIADNHWFWQALQNTLMRQNDPAIIGAFLDRGLFATPMVWQADINAQDDTLTRLSTWRRNVTAWARVGDQNIFVSEAFRPGAFYDGLVYQITACLLTERADLLTQLEEARQELVSFNLNAAGVTLFALARSLPHGAPSPPMRLLHQYGELPDMVALNTQRGALRAYGRFSPGPHGAAKRHVHRVFAVVDDGQRYEHRFLFSSPRGLQAIVQRWCPEWRVCALVPDGENLVVLVQRGQKRQVTPRLQWDPGANTVAVARQALLTRDDATALSALRQLSTLPPNNPWHALAPRLAALLQEMPTAPWQAAVGLATVVEEERGAPTQERRVAGGELRPVLTRWCQRLIDNVTAAQLATMARERVADGPVQTRLLNAMVSTMRFSSVTSPRDGLLHCIRRCLLKETSVLAALCGPTLTHVPGPNGGHSLYEEAVATGNPALAEAVDGNPHAAFSWARMHPIQQQILVRLGQEAVQRSAAATTDLEARLATLDPERPAAETAATLRHYLRREAAVWINFRPSAALVNTTVYVPRSYERGAMEQKRFANMYHTLQAKDVQRPIYAFVNGQKSLHGFTNYGLAAFLLQDSVRPQMTVVARAQHDAYERIGTLHAMDHVLCDLQDATLHHYLAVATGNRLSRPWLSEHLPANLAPIIEAHIHGPVSLLTDVRKTVASPYLNPKPDDVRKLKQIATQLHVPLRWRGQVNARSDATADLRRTLDLASNLGLDIAAWTHAGKNDGQRFYARHSADGLRASSHHYDLLATSLKSLAPRLAMIAREGGEVAAMRVAPYNGRGPALARKVEAVVRYPNTLGNERTVRLQRTFALPERLRQLDATHWRVQTISDVQVPDSPTPQYHMVLEYRPDQAYEHHLYTLPHTDSHTVENAVAQERKRGWRWVGFASHHALGPSKLLFQRAVDEIQPVGASTRTYANSTTLINDDPLELIPDKLLWVSQNNYAFDVDELMDVIQVRGTWTNPYTNAAFSDAEIGELLAHPSGVGPTLAAALSENDGPISAISVATATQLFQLGRLLEQEDTRGPMTEATNAVDAFASYVRTLPTAEQVALFGTRFALVDTHNQPFRLSVMQALTGVQAHTGCSRATGRYLQTMARTMAPNL